MYEVSETSASGQGSMELRHVKGSLFRVDALVPQHVVPAGHEVVPEDPHSWRPAATHTPRPQEVPERQT